MPRGKINPDTPLCGVVYKGRPPCRQPAGFGTAHNGSGPCRFHGGNLPDVSVKHEADLIERRAARAAIRFGQPIPGADPEQMMLDSVSISAGLVAYYETALWQAVEAEEKAAGVAPGTWGRNIASYSRGSALVGPEISVDGAGIEHVIGEKERIMLKLYNEERDRLVSYSKAALSAGIERRRVEMAERQGEQVVLVVQNVLIELGLPETTLQQARTLIATGFRRLSESEVQG
jgi:hypothetical protein